MIGWCSRQNSAFPFVVFYKRFPATNNAVSCSDGWLALLVVVSQAYLSQFLRKVSSIKHYCVNLSKITHIIILSSKI